VNKQALEGLGAEYNVYKERLVGEKRQRKDLVQTFRSVSAKKEREQEELAAVMDFEGRLSKEVQQQKEGVVRIQSLFEKEVKYRQGVTQSTFAQYLPLPLHILLAQAAFEAKKWNKNNLKKKKLGNSNNNSLSLSLSVSIGGSSDDLHEYLSRLSQTSAHSLLSQKKANGNGNSKEGGSESESDLSLQEKESILLVSLHPLSVNIKMDIDQGMATTAEESVVGQQQQQKQSRIEEEEGEEGEEHVPKKKSTTSGTKDNTRQSQSYRFKFYYHPHLGSVFVQSSKDVVEALRLMHPEDPGEKLETILSLAVAKNNSNASQVDLSGEKKKKSQSAATGALPAEDKKVHHSSGGLNKKDFPSYLGSQKVETMRKFQWAQDLCGVSSLGPDPSNKEEEEERVLSQVKTVSKKRGFGRLVKGLLETTCNK
jgi:hypothetical protein